MWPAASGANVRKKALPMVRAAPGRAARRTRRTRRPASDGRALDPAPVHRFGDSGHLRRQCNGIRRHGDCQRSIARLYQQGDGCFRSQLRALHPQRPVVAAIHIHVSTWQPDPHRHEHVVPVEYWHALRNSLWSLDLSCHLPHHRHLRRISQCRLESRGTQRGRFRCGIRIVRRADRVILAR